MRYIIRRLSQFDNKVVPCEGAKLPVYYDGMDEDNWELDHALWYIDVEDIHGFIDMYGSVVIIPVKGCDKPDLIGCIEYEGIKYKLEIYDYYRE